MIKEFKNNEEYKKFVSSVTRNCSLGFGGEGECYLGKDNMVYKVINEESIDSYNIDQIITTDQYNLSHYAFPIDVYTDQNHEKLFGYTSKYYKNNMFEDINFVEDVNFYIEQLVSSYKKMMEETKVLSDDNILIFDTINNLLFSNYELVAIDTLGYYKDNKSTLKRNKDILLRAIEQEFYFQSDLNSMFQDEKSIDQIARNVKKYVKLREY